MRAEGGKWERNLDGEDACLIDRASLSKGKAGTSPLADAFCLSDVLL